MGRDVDFHCFDICAEPLPLVPPVVRMDTRIKSGYDEIVDVLTQKLVIAGLDPAIHWAVP